jgi:hypothetical protein
MSKSSSLELKPSFRRYSAQTLAPFGPITLFRTGSGTIQHYPKGLLVLSFPFRRDILLITLLGQAQLNQFCEDCRSSFPQSVYTPDADYPLITSSGELNYAAVPYIFASNQANLPFVNWGEVFFAMENTTDAKISFAVETWNRKRWPQN